MTVWSANETKCSNNNRSDYFSLWRSPWQDISMDFIEGLPRVNEKSIILTVVNRFSKYAHFVPLSHPYIAESVARVFFDEVVRLHGFPCSHR